ncbi:hypothetical protein IMSAGC022_00589 [Alistipes sp.]|nr:hypothetical protein IMSAGC022_00589 [Alistipes sp.]
MNTQQYFLGRFILLFKQISIVGSIISSIARLKQLHFSYYIFISSYRLVPTLIKKSDSSHNGITRLLGHTSFLNFPYNRYFRNPSLQILQQRRNNLATFRFGSLCFGQSQRSRQIGNIAEHGGQIAIHQSPQCYGFRLVCIYLFGLHRNTLHIFHQHVATLNNLIIGLPVHRETFISSGRSTFRNRTSQHPVTPCVVSIVRTGFTS